MTLITSNPSRSPARSASTLMPAPQSNALTGASLRNAIRFDGGSKPPPISP
jgi:hypothetical protein